MSIPSTSSPRRARRPGPVRRSRAAAAAVALTGAAVLVPSAASATPSSFVEDFSFVAEGICAFPFTWSVHNEVLYTTRSTTSEVVETDHIVEVDTLIANGKVVQGLPYHWNAVYTSDLDGHLTDVVVQGETLRFMLPDGGMFALGGREDWFTELFTGSPRKEDLGWVCDALAP